MIPHIETSPATRKSAAPIGGIHDVDLHVGTRVRMRRKFLGLSQGDLANSIDLTFQQVQKYERGSNRISASKLYEIANALGVPVGYFFEGMPQADGGVSDVEQDVNSFMMTTEGVELAQVFPKLSAHVRRATMVYLNKLAGEE